MVFTLRIKKVYFDQILNGIKTVEYRSDKPYYSKLKEAKQLKLHCQSGLVLAVNVLEVKLIDTPLELKHSGIDFTDKVWAIKLENPRLL